MKKIVCEVCNGISFSKTEGNYICNDCGMQYSLEDVKRLLVDDVDENKTKDDNLSKKLIPDEENNYKKIKEDDFDDEEDIIEDDEEELIKIKKDFEEDDEEEQSDILKNENLTDNEIQEKESFFRGIKREFKDILKLCKTDKVGKILLIITVGFAVLSIVGIILIFVLSNKRGNKILFGISIVQILSAVISYKVMMHRERFICPECGKKRIHHRRFLYTTSSTNNVTHGGYGQGVQVSYTHVYEDTYTCESCGEVRTERVSKSGGTYTEYSSGRVEDRCKEPREF